MTHDPHPTTPAGRRACRLGYGDTVVVDGLDLDVLDGTVTAVIGPNGCGKSTLLRALARLLPARRGHGAARRPARSTAPPTREVAKVLGLLPQTPSAPEGLTVADLVARGRHPHQAWYRQWSSDDEAVVAAGAGAGPASTEFAERTRRRAVRRAAPARVDLDGAGPGHRPAAARRAHHVPRPRPPDRRAGPRAAAAPRGRADRRDGAARPLPRRPLRATASSRCRTGASSRTAPPTRCSRPSSCAASSTWRRRSCWTRSRARRWSSRSVGGTGRRCTSPEALAFLAVGEVAQRAGGAVAGLVRGKRSP